MSRFAVVADRLSEDCETAYAAEDVAARVRRVGRFAATAAVLLCAVAAGCAHAVNYLDPDTPFYRFRGEERAAPADVPPLRVVSFNIEYGIHVDRALEALRASQPLRDPDLLALQEMDAPGVERVARELRLNAVYFPSGVHPKHKRDFGCALLSPWPLEEPRKLVLPHAARGTHLRGSAVSATLVRGEFRARVYCVHLPSPLGVSGGSRREEVQTVIADADGAAASGLPVVVAGDFNAHGLGEIFERAGWAWPTRDIGATARWTVFGLHYDHVFARGFADATAGERSAGVVADNRDASDHKPIWAVLLPRLPAAGEPGAQPPPESRRSDAPRR